MIVKLCALVLLAISSINTPSDRLDAESADDKIFLHYGSRSKPDSARTVKDDSRRGRSTSTHRNYVSMPANSRSEERRVGKEWRSRMRPSDTRGRNARCKETG